jgi:hypothetical protein
MRTISAKQLQGQLGIGCHETAWAMLQELPDGRLPDLLASGSRTARSATATTSTAPLGRPPVRTLDWARKSTPPRAQTAAK